MAFLSYAVAKVAGLEPETFALISRGRKGAETYMSRFMSENQVRARLRSMFQEDDEIARLMKKAGSDGLSVYLNVEIRQTVDGHEWRNEFPLAGTPQYFQRCHNPRCVDGGFDLASTILLMGPDGTEREISFGCRECATEFTVKVTPQISAALAS